MTEEKEEKARVALDMPCRCSDEGAADADALRREVAAGLECEPDDPNFVSWIIASLNWDFNWTYVDGIAHDMWFGVSAESSDEKIFVPCDRVEDGLAAIWKYLNDKKVEAK